MSPVIISYFGYKLFNIMLTSQSLIMNGIYHSSSLHIIRTLQVQYFSDSFRFGYTDVLSCYSKTEVEIFS